MEQKPVILAMYSGGLDSLGMIYKLLTEPEYKDFALHIHHVHNKNFEKRARAEGITVNVALTELKRIGFEFVVSESEISLPQHTPTFLYDIDIVNFFAGGIARVNKNIVSIAMGINATDRNHSSNHRRKRADKILAAFTPVGKIYPVLNMSKREIYDMLPESLKDKFWSCRRPVYSDKTIKHCGKCKTCKQLQHEGIKNVDS